MNVFESRGGTGPETEGAVRMCPSTANLFASARARRVAFRDLKFPRLSHGARADSRHEEAA